MEGGDYDSYKTSPDNRERIVRKPRKDRFGGLCV